MPDPRRPRDGGIADAAADVSDGLCRIRRQQAEQRLEFLKQLAAHEHKITAAAAQLESYREQILADFVRQADRHIEEIEPKIYASTSRRVVQDIDKANARLEGRLKILLAATLAAVSVLAVSVVWLVFTVSKTG